MSHSLPLFWVSLVPSALISPVTHFSGGAFSAFAGLEVSFMVSCANDMVTPSARHMASNAITNFFMGKALLRLSFDCELMLSLPELRAGSNPGLPGAQLYPLGQGN